MTTFADVKIEELEEVEEEGVVRSLIRNFLVTGLTATGLPTPLTQAKAASGIPQHGDAAPGNTNLVVYRRTARIVPNTPTACYVTVEYKTVGDWENSFIFSGGTNLSDIQTDVDYFGNRISLSYTYPETYPDENLRGQVYTTAINESVKSPETVLTATGSLYVEYPNEISAEWVGRLNSTFWAGAPAGYWLCTSCEFTPRDIGFGRPHLWQFTWTFQYKPQSWIVIAKIVDPNTGQVPADVVLNTGVKQIDWYPWKDFNIIFGNT